MKGYVDAVLIGVWMMVGSGCGDDGSMTVTSDDYTTADKDGMGASVGDTGVYGTLEVTVTGGNFLKFDTGDGWTVQFDKYLLTVGAFGAPSADTESHDLQDSQTAVVDARSLVSSPYTLAAFDRVAAGRYEPVSFALPNAAATSVGAPQTLKADLDLMIKGRYSVYVEGSMTRTGGQSCTPGSPKDCTPAEKISFRWGYSAGMKYDQCDGFEVWDGATSTVRLFMTSLHWFAPGFAEATSPSRAQWIADADLDHNGETTLAELQKIKASDLFDASYDLSGAPIKIVTAYDFAEAQARNLGRSSYGYCETSRAL